MKRFEGMIVLVTGGNRNTGLDIVEKFVREGATVYMCGSSETSTTKGLELLKARGVEGVKAQACDISDAVQVTPVWFDNGTYYHVAQVYPDGSQLVEVSFLFGGLPDGMTVKLEIFVSGVTFEDGTRTKVLTASDMDENGHCTVRFIKARGVTTSVCHRTYIYQDGQLIYTNK